MSIIREGNHDRAWNDPPKFPLGTSEPRARTRLNKRVMYTPGIPTSPAITVPVSAPSSPLTTTENVNVFTPPDFHPVSRSPSGASPPAFATSKVDTSEVPDMLSSLMLEEVYSSLVDVLSKVQDRISARKLEDIKKRLEIMNSQWLSETLSDQTKKLMYLLAMKLRSFDSDEAARIQVALISNYSSEVSQWIVGVKHLILEFQSKNVKV